MIDEANVAPGHKYEWILYGVLMLICLTARLHLLNTIGLKDYDSVRNWQILNEIAQGNFDNLFHHASPGFFLFYAIFTPFFEGFYGFIILNVFFSSGTVLILVRFIRKNLNQPIPEAFLTGLLFGLSVFAVHSSRDLAIESLNLFLFMLLLDLYYERVLYHDARALLKAVIVLAIGLTINYKLLLVIPVFLIMEFIQRDKIINKKVFIRIILILLAPFLLFALVAIMVNQPFYKFPAAIISINNFTQPNPAQRIGRFNLEPLYYLRYIVDFELPLLVPAIFLFPVIYRQKLFRNYFRQLNIYQYLFIVIYLYLFGMQVLLKAPRGLSIIYGLLYLILYLIFKRLITKRFWLLLILSIGIAYQVWKLDKIVYPYAHSAYPEVAEYLQQKGIKKVAVTVGRGIIPFALKKGIEVKVVFSEAELKTLREDGYNYILQDYYYKAANIQKFTRIEKLPALQTWREPTLLNPLLYLDHSEFTGLTYTQTLNLNKRVIQHPAQLRLLVLP